MGCSRELKFASEIKELGFPFNRKLYKSYNMLELFAKVLAGSDPFLTLVELKSLMQNNKFYELQLLDVSQYFSFYLHWIALNYSLNTDMLIILSILLECFDRFSIKIFFGLIKRIKRENCWFEKELLYQGCVLWDKRCYQVSCCLFVCERLWLIEAA